MPHITAVPSVPPSRHYVRVHWGAITLAGLISVVTFGVPAGVANVGTSDAKSTWAAGVTVVQDSPLGERDGSAIATRGSKVFVIGGTLMANGSPIRRPNDGAVLDLRTGRWTPMPDAPFRRVGVLAAQWAGKTLVVAGRRCPDAVGSEAGCANGRTVAATLVPDTRTWRSIPVPKQYRGGTSGLSALLAGREEATFLYGESRAVAIDPTRDRWRDISPPLSPVTESKCATARYAAAIDLPPSEGTDNRFRLLREGDKAWRTAAPLVRTDALPQRPACTRSGVVVADPDLKEISLYDLETSAWRKVEPPMLAEQLSNYISTGHGNYVDFFARPATGRPEVRSSGPGLRLNTTTGEWSTIAPGPNLQADLGGIHWVNGLAVLQEFGQVMVYRP